MSKEHAIHEAGGPVLYTIGYGQRSVEVVVALLRQHKIRRLIDVRSAPYSRFKPEFSREPLALELERQGVVYEFMGDTLGGQPRDPACYTDGKVDYDKVRAQPCFGLGLDRLQGLLSQPERLVLMCSEARPEECHRSKLIGEAAVARRIEVRHIDADDQLLTQAQTISRLTGGQLELFGGPSFTSRNRYRPASVGKRRPQ
jgi:uncharacterized protein (DUF488 family)